MENPQHYDNLIKVNKIQIRNLINNLLDATAIVVPISPVLFTMMMEALHSSETPVLTRAIRRNIPEDGIINENL
jgi:hypothetical protein